jgi:cytochrome b involved in lipid metabolism
VTSLSVQFIFLLFFREMAKEYSTQEVAAHTKSSDMWMVIHGKVYNVTDFVSEHPGGEEIMMEQAGQDATESFEDIGHSKDAKDILQTMLIGVVSDPTKPTEKVATPVAAKPPSYSAFYVLLPILVASLVYYHFASAK